MPSFLHQPGYADFPLRFPQGLWLHSSRWEQTDFDYFAQERQSHAQKILAFPKLYRRKRKATPSLDSSWIFKSDEAQPAQGWAELQSFPGKYFSKGFLFYALDEPTIEIAQEALVSLTSLVFTLSKNDHLQIIPVTRNGSLVERISHLTGAVQNMMSLPAHPWHPESGGFQPFSSLEVDRSSWRACSALQPAMRQLKHIELRMERLDRMGEGRAKRKKKRNFLVRLFKPKIDDSLF